MPNRQLSAAKHNATAHTTAQATMHRKVIYALKPGGNCARNGMGFAWCAMAIGEHPPAQRRTKKGCAIACTPPYL